MARGRITRSHLSNVDWCVIYMRCFDGLQTACMAKFVTISLIHITVANQEGSDLRAVKVELIEVSGDI